MCDRLAKTPQALVTSCSR